MTNRRQLLTGAAGIAAAALIGTSAARAQTKLPDAGPLGDVWLGPADAKVTVIEYASMTCSHCAHFHETTWPELKKKYIDTGKIRFTLREFPLDPLAMAGFMLARCNGNDKYYPMTDLLFAQQKNWAFVDKPVDALSTLVKQAGFTAEEFALLDEAGKRSDALIKLETDAMNLVDNIPTLGPDAKAKATAMLSSPDYHKFKAEIMKPVDAFFVKLEGRTQAAIDEANARAGFYWMLTTVAMAVLILMLAIVGFVTFKRIIGGMGKLGKSMEQVAGGQLDTQIALAGQNDEIGDMGKALEVFREAAIANRRMEREAEEGRRRAEVERIAMQEKAELDAAERLRVATSGLAAGLKRLASGDLAFQLNEAFAEDFEALRHDFNQSVAQLRETLSAISGSISILDTGTREIAVGTDNLSKRTEQQAASLEETAAALDEITANVASSSKRTEEARSVASRANHSAAESAQVVSHAEEAMRKIEESSQQISNIIGVIDEIAFQTNLLALNAAVEAARAGDAGKGFAVVATEVRSLAKRSADASNDVKKLVEAAHGDVKVGVGLVEETSAMFGAIMGSVNELTKLMNGIAQTAKSQASDVSTINTEIDGIGTMAHQNAALVEETNAALALTDEQTRALTEHIARFQFREGHAGGHEAKQDLSEAA